jgi:subtilisin family serine protease
MKPPALVKAMEYAKEKNVLFLAAAGNGDAQTGVGFDIKVRPSFPASIDMENTICVAATSLGEITSYSNFSEELVHVAAPGGDQRQFVVSLAKQNPMGMPFAAQAGTSMATPIVSGVAALMLSANPSLTPKDIKALLIQTGDGLPTLKNKTVNGKIVNVQQAVQAALDFQPVL